MAPKKWTDEVSVEKPSCLCLLAARCLPNCLEKIITSVYMHISTALCMLYHMQDLMMLSEGQVQDLLYLYHLENARVAQLKAQREAAVNKLIGNSHSADAILKQHPSDSIIVSNDVADQLRKIGLAQYKLRGIVYDTFFHGVWLSFAA